jgi:hypothetical protein
VLDGELIHGLPTREVAKRLGLLQQQHSLPEGISVESLVGRGRFPHQGFLQPPTRKDAEAVDRALALTDMLELRKRPVDQLSGGQRQRAWMAMILAQETSLLVLDEPTTYLDIAHQLEIIELVRRLNVDEGPHRGDGAARRERGGQRQRPHRRHARRARRARGAAERGDRAGNCCTSLYGVDLRRLSASRGRAPVLHPAQRGHVATCGSPVRWRVGVQVQGVRFGYDAD